MWTGWLSYLTAMRDVLGLKLEAHQNFAAWEDAGREGGFRVMHEKFCIVSDFPEILRMDDQHQPHCEDGPSHRWRDGWSLYHWHGVRVPAEWIEDRANLDPRIALTWENIEQRRVAAEIIGWDRVLEQVEATTVNEDEDPEIGTLLEVDLPDIGRERFLRVQCGTGRHFAIPVPPEMQTALEANAWTYGVDQDIIKAMEVRT